MEQKPVSKGKSLLIWVVIFTLGILVYHRTRETEARRFVEYPRFIEQVEAGQVGEVVIDSNSLAVTLWETGETYETIGYADEQLQKKLSEHGVRVSHSRVGTSGVVWWLVAGIAAILVLVILFGKISSSASGSVLQLGRSRARLVEENTATFEAVGGCEEAKERLGDAIAFLRNPARWIDSGVRLPRGILLEGPPGCGKTLLARAVAGEAGVPFYCVSASEFVELFVGVGAARVRDMFEQARKNAPAIIFVDELDAVGRRRGSGVGCAHDEREQTLNQLLVCLDGFEVNESVIVMAATNRADILDPALLRPGRFDVQVRVGRPEETARLATLEIHTVGKSVAADVSLAELASRTAGASGADLENLCNEAGLHAVRRAVDEDREVEIRKADFERALGSFRQSGDEFDKLDGVLIESATQLAQPSGGAIVRVTTAEGEHLEGTVVWADACFVKLRLGAADTGSVVPRSARHVVVAKAQIRELRALAGTASESPENIVQDPWAGVVTELAQ